MKISLNLIKDTENTDPREALEIEPVGDTVWLRITDGSREVAVRRSELMAMLNLLNEQRT